MVGVSASSRDFLRHPLQGKRADSGKRWHKAGVEEPLSGAENRRREKIGAVMMYGQQHYLEATRLTDGQLLVVCSDKEGKGIEAYGERWQIKTLFGSLKSKGFNLEDTHMTAPAKIDRLMSVLAIGFVLSCRAGLDRLVSVLSRGMRLLEVLGGEVMDLLAVKEEVG